MKRKTNDEVKAYDDGRWTALCGGEENENPFVYRNGRVSDQDLYYHWADGFEDGLIEMSKNPS